MKTVMMLLKCLESLISYSARKASSSSKAEVMGVIIHDLVVGIIYAVILGLVSHTVGKPVFLIISSIIISLLIIIMILQNRIQVKTLKGIVSREGFLQRVEVGVNP